MAKNVPTTQNTSAVAVPSYLQQGSARGTEHVGHEDLVVPRLEIVQALSDCRKKASPDFIEGAEEGMMYNSVTRELYGSAAVVVPVAFRKEFLLWKDRKKGGGFKGAFASAAEAEAARAKLEDADDIEVNDTAQHFCYLVKPDNSIEEIVVSMAKSKLKCSRKWNSLIRINNVDSFAKKYKLVGVAAVNANNDQYYTFDVSALPGFVDEDVYHRAEKLWKTIESGAVKVSTEGMKDEETSSEEF